MFASEGDLHLELPSGDIEAPRVLWVSSQRKLTMLRPKKKKLSILLKHINLSNCI